MSTLKKRTRLAAVATATLTGASIFALAAPANAAAVPPDSVPSINSKAIGGVNKITVSWNRANTGEPATSYVVVAYAHNPAAPPNYIGAPIKTVIVLDTTNDGIANPPTTAVVEDLAAGLYQIEIFANNAYGSSGPTQPINYVWATGVAVTNPVVIPPTQEANTRAYRPYGSWDEMIIREYKLYTGFSKSGGPIGGREPRLDELTFWRYRIALAPFTDDEWDNYTDYYWARYEYLTYDPDGVNPPGVLWAPADTDRDGIISPAEDAAADLLAEDWAENDVLFDRREEFAAWLAEEAEQTDGPAYRLYTAYFSRNPDFGGLAFWSTRLRTGGNLLNVSEFFLDSDEFIEKYGEYETYAPEGPKTDAAEFVALIYKNVLDRVPDGSGFSFWTRQLQTERYTPAEVLIGFSESHEFKERMHRRVVTGVNYAHLLGRMPTEAEYVLHEFYGEFFWDNPMEVGTSWVFDPLLGVNVPVASGYQLVIDSAEYKARATA